METKDLTNVANFNYGIEKIFEEAKVISLHIPILRSNGKSNINFINS